MNVFKITTVFSVCAHDILDAQKTILSVIEDRDRKFVFLSSIEAEEIR